MNYINWKKAKNEINENEYFNVAQWCNESGEYTIEEKGNYFQVVKIPEPTAEELAQVEILNLKQYLSNTDYVVLKIAEGVATATDYADVLTQRQEARARINELEG